MKEMPIASVSVYTRKSARCRREPGPMKTMIDLRSFVPHFEELAARAHRSEISATDLRTALRDWSAQVGELLLDDTTTTSERDPFASWWNLARWHRKLRSFEQDAGIVLGSRVEDSGLRSAALWHVCSPNRLQGIEQDVSKRTNDVNRDHVLRLLANVRRVRNRRTTPGKAPPDWSNLLFFVEEIAFTVLTNTDSNQTGTRDPVHRYVLFIAKAHRCARYEHPQIASVTSSPTLRPDALSLAMKASQDLRESETLGRTRVESFLARHVLLERLKRSDLIRQPWTIDSGKRAPSILASDYAPDRGDAPDRTWLFDFATATAKFCSRHAPSSVADTELKSARLPRHPEAERSTPAHEATHCAHSPDYTSVIWFGVEYRFTRPQQAKVIQILWEARENGTPTVSLSAIREGIDSSNDHFRLEDVFRVAKRKRTYHPAFSMMIRRVGKGLYALKEPDREASAPSSSAAKDEQKPQKKPQ